MVDFWEEVRVQPGHHIACCSDHEARMARSRSRSPVRERKRDRSRSRERARDDREHKRRRDEKEERPADYRAERAERDRLVPRGLATKVFWHLTTCRTAQGLVCITTLNLPPVSLRGLA